MGDAMKLKMRILFYFLALAPLTAHAQKIYLCKDASGHTLTSDRPIPECAERAVREMDSHGVVRRDVAAPLTAEQKQQKKLEEEKRKAEEAAAAEQKQNDLGLLARYRNENDIAIARTRTLDQVQEHIKRETASLAGAEARRKEAQADIKKVANKKTIPPALQRKLDEADKASAEAKQRLQDYEAERANINANYDATLKRYRELSGAAAAK
jgi:cell division protein FtsN